MQELWFLCSACHQLLNDIYMKFHEYSLNSFQVIEWTLFCDTQSSKGNNSKSINARIMVLAFCTLSNADWYLYEVSWRYLEQFSSYRADKILWQTKFHGKWLKKYKCKSCGSCALHVVYCWLIFIWNFCEDSLNGFQVIEWTPFCERQTDTWGKKQYVFLP